MHPLFPHAPDEAALDKALEEHDFQPAARAAVQLLGATGEIVRYTAGSLPVFAVGDHTVIKLFPPLDAEGVQVECDTLKAFDGVDAIPRLLGCFPLEDWQVVAMSQLPGVGLDGTWKELPNDIRLDLACQCGALMRAMHDKTIGPETPDVPSHRVWQEWKRGQIDGLVERQRKLGLGDPWLDQLEPFVRKHLDSASPRGIALLHTEVMPAHLTVAGTPPAIVGLCDFEPAMVGDIDYEFASIGAFMTEGDGPALAQVLEGWGIPATERIPELSRRLMAMLLIHRYSHLPRYLGRMPTPSEPTLDALAQSWFGFE